MKKITIMTDNEFNKVYWDMQRDEDNFHCDVNYSGRPTQNVKDGAFIYVRMTDDAIIFASFNEKEYEYEKRYVKDYNDYINIMKKYKKEKKKIKKITSKRKEILKKEIFDAYINFESIFIYKDYKSVNRGNESTFYFFRDESNYIFSSKGYDFYEYICNYIDEIKDENGYNFDENYYNIKNINFLKNEAEEWVNNDIEYLENL